MGALQLEPRPTDWNAGILLGEDTRANRVFDVQLLGLRQTYASPGPAQFRELRTVIESLAA